jgi:hypothetical protein
VTRHGAKAVERRVRLTPRIDLEHAAAASSSSLVGACQIFAHTCQLYRDRLRLPWHAIFERSKEHSIVNLRPAGEDLGADGPLFSFVRFRPYDATGGPSAIPQPCRRAVAHASNCSGGESRGWSRRVSATLSTVNLIGGRLQRARLLIQIKVTGSSYR